MHLKNMTLLLQKQTVGFMYTRSLTNGQYQRVSWVWENQKGTHLLQHILRCAYSEA